MQRGQGLGLGARRCCLHPERCVLHAGAAAAPRHRSLPNASQRRAHPALPCPALPCPSSPPACADWQPPAGTLPEGASFHPRTWLVFSDRHARVDSVLEEVRRRGGTACTACKACRRRVGAGRGSGSGPQGVAAAGHRRGGGTQLYAWPPPAAPLACCHDPLLPCRSDVPAALLSLRPAAGPSIPRRIRVRVRAGWGRSSGLSALGLVACWPRGTQETGSHSQLPTPLLPTPPHPIPPTHPPTHPLPAAAWAATLTAGRP